MQVKPSPCAAMVLIPTPVGLAHDDRDLGRWLSAKDDDGCCCG